MDFDAITVFVKVVECRSFSAAARLLDMPKTTVSGKIAALEQRLEVTLIQRTTRKLHVTEAGELYFKHCVAAVRELNNAESMLHVGKSKASGLLKVAAPVDIGHSILPGIVKSYMEKYPEVEIELMVTNRKVDLVHEGVDIAIHVGDLPDSTLIAKKFFDVRTGFWASPKYLKKFGSPEHPRDFAKHKLILHQMAKSQKFVVSDGKSKFSLTGKSKIYVDDFETIKALVLMDQGISLLADFAVEKERARGSLVKILPRWSLGDSLTVWMVYPGQHFTSLKVRAFMDEALRFS